jgi:hypothetical protein
MDTLYNHSLDCGSWRYSAILTPPNRVISTDRAVTTILIGHNRT